MGRRDGLCVEVEVCNSAQHTHLSLEEALIQTVIKAAAAVTVTAVCLRTIHFI